MQKKEEDWETLAKEYLDGWKRERAAFDNYKKDEALRMDQLRLWMTRAFLAKLFPIIDSFELALKHTPEEMKASDWFSGYTYIKKQFGDILKEEGIEEIDTKGKEFDPRFMEAVEKEEGEGEKLMVSEELQKGYKIGDYMLRPARVRVQHIKVDVPSKGGEQIPNS
ncbi:MAG: nucleotide exchange factor GrpE [Candidatus Portnoybacteria bacterium]|nr:nucleotide exchange factor GrpE [Candidatus Portnoybacteria bacterium]